MTLLRSVFLLLLTAAAAACTTGQPLGPGMCGGESLQPWQRLSSPPVDAARYLAIAKAHPVFPSSTALNEQWFSAPSGVLLCRRTTDREGGETGEWWQFDAAETPQLLASDGWITTNHPARN